MAWEVEYTDQFVTWWGGLAIREQLAIGKAAELLAERGPGLGRPLVDTIRGSRHPNMKELRAVGGNLRVLFAFDPQRRAIFLVGGDKTGRWQEWYRTMIPIADDLFDAHLQGIAGES